MYRGLWWGHVNVHESAWDKDGILRCVGVNAGRSWGASSYIIRSVSLGERAKRASKGRGSCMVVRGRFFVGRKINIRKGLTLRKFINNIVL